MNDDWALDYEYDANNRLNRYYVDKKGIEFIARMIPYGTEVTFKDSSGNIISDKVTKDLYIVTNKQGISTLKTITEFQLNFIEGRRTDYEFEIDSLVLSSTDFWYNELYNFYDIKLKSPTVTVDIHSIEPFTAIFSKDSEANIVGRKYKIILTPF